MNSGGSEPEAMRDLASFLWGRFLRERVLEELTHEMNAFRAEVVTNNGNGTLTVKRPFEDNTLTLRAASSLRWAQAGEQVLILGIGAKSKALSNAMVLCYADGSSFSSPKMDQLLIGVLQQNGIWPLKTTSGSPAEFDDGEAGLTLKEFLAEILAVQDFNGYGKPWAGGTNVNLFDCPAVASTTNKVTLTPNGDGSFTLTGDANSTSGNFFVPLPGELPANTTVTISLNNNAINNEVGVRLVRRVTGSSTQYGTLVRANVLNRTETVSSSFAATDVNVVAASNHGDISAITFKVQVEKGSEATPWTPYENICPIYGRTGVTLSHSGEDPSDAETITVYWEEEAGAICGGVLNATTGVLTVTYGYIASYAGEYLPGEWISDRDVYAPGTSPTTGAEVAYVLAVPEKYLLPPEDISVLPGTNLIWTDSGAATVTYRISYDDYIQETMAVG